LDNGSKVKVGKVLPGFPNYNYETSDDGTIIREYKPISGKSQIDSVVDTGYIVNGELKLRGVDDEGIITTFVHNQLRRKTDSKYPIVIVKTGNNKIAFPVKIGRVSPVVTKQDMLDVWNQNIDSVSKSILLNELLGKAGIDVSQSDNCFFALNGSQPLDETFFNDKVSQLENKSYLRDVDDFTSSELSKEEILNGATISINMNEPFISPKLLLDLSDIKVEVKESLKDINNTKNNAGTKNALNVVYSSFSQPNKC
jgi:hypothetical protein